MLCFVQYLYLYFAFFVCVFVRVLLQVSTVLVLFPDGNQVVVPFKEDTLLLHLLPKISKLKRLRLYTNEYVFSVSAADQKHLKVSKREGDKSM